MDKEPQGSVKGKNKPREVWDRERSQEKGELCGNSEGYLNTAVEALVQPKGLHRLPTSRSEGVLWAAHSPPPPNNK
jgi:hypothetical protein